jgi:hypothetical protein
MHNFKPRKTRQDLEKYFNGDEKEWKAYKEYTELIAMKWWRYAKHLVVEKYNIKSKFKR